MVLAKRDYPATGPRMKFDSEIKSALTRLEADMGQIDLIDRQLRAFNIFEVLDIQRRELQHSNFLAYLLDPSARHGLGAAFLNAFAEALVNQNRERSEISVELAKALGSD